ncbi:MAG: AAA family ATPase [Anaerolineae bacterium]
MTPSALQICLLGGYRVDYDTSPVSALNTPRLQALLAYLCLHADLPQSRQHIAFQLWPDTPETHARNNLRQLLYQLRHALPNADDYLVIDGNAITWRSGRGQEIDVRSFSQALRDADAAEQAGDIKAARRCYEQALDLYRGDLLPGCYDDWIQPERDKLREQYRIAHARLAQILEQERDYAEAIRIAQSLVRLDPLDENSYVLLMRLHALTRDRAAVRRIYLAAIERFSEELGVEPGEALRQGFETARGLLVAPPALSARDAASQTPVGLVGRQREWRALLATWQAATHGAAQMALIEGEAGIGKSRLAEELYTWAQGQGFAAAYTRSYAAEGRLSLAPVTNWLRSAPIRPHLSTLSDIWLTEVSRLLPELLADMPQLPRPEPIGEYGQRQRFFEALAHAVLAAPRPLLLWIDDLQWCDSETLEWLHFLLRFEPRSELLIVGTARVEESLPHAPLAALTQQLRSEGSLAAIELRPLDAAETARLASQIEGRALDEAAALRLFRATEGNPLFVVETVRAGMGSALAGEGYKAPAADKAYELPPRAYAVLAGRLAQLSDSARHVAERAAVIGREFTLDTLLHAGDEDEAAVVQALDELWYKRIIREQAPNLFDFTHDKLREVAYAEMGAPQRRVLHRHVAQALEALNADTLDAVSAQIAAQYEQGGAIEQAIPYYQRAAAVAASVYANADAIALLNRALMLLAGTAPGMRRDSRELALLLALATLYRITRGWTSPETERVVKRSLMLSEKVGTVFQRAQAMYSAHTYYVVSAQLNKVESEYPELNRLFLQAGEESPFFAAIMYAGARLHAGHIAEARELFERMLSVRDDGQVRDVQMSHGINYRAHGYAWNAHALWCLGYPQSAYECATRAVEIAREFAQPFNQALTITYLAMLQEFRSDTSTFRAHAETAAAISQAYEAPYYAAWAEVLVAFALAAQEPSPTSLAGLREAIDALTTTGTRLRLPYFLSLAARAYWRAGDLDAAMNAVEEAFEASLHTNERWWDGELHRLRGELLHAQGADGEDVENAFRRALEIARSQEAKSIELRAATSLAQSWLAQGRAAEARQVLVPVYEWFTEGFDTPDLRAAQAVIAQLPGRHREEDDFRRGEGRSFPRTKRSPDR